MVIGLPKQQAMTQNAACMTYMNNVKTIVQTLFTNEKRTACFFVPDIPSRRQKQTFFKVKLFQGLLYSLNSQQYILVVLKSTDIQVMKIHGVDDSQQCGVRIQRLPIQWEFMKDCLCIV